MCGIAGILHFNKISDAPERLTSMVDAQLHRGPDANHTVFLPEIALGHCRLSIIDLRQDANQPMRDADDRFLLLFNGEIYNYKELKAKLSDYPYATSSDTEIVLAAFSKWGIDCVHRLHGMFAFAIWDKQTQTLWLARDRFGTKPLLLYQSNNSFLFASERRALLSSGLIPRTIDEKGLFEFLSYQSSGYPNTMIKGIEAIPPGTYLKITEHQCELTTYYDFSHIKVNPEISAENLQPVLLDKLYNAVSSRLTGDVPIGVFLSGGLDSSAVTALMSLISPSKINTFHLSIQDDSKSESTYADLIAKKFDTHHVQYSIHKDEVLHKITEALDTMDSPTMDGINTYLLSRVIKQYGFKVALSGLGGDELFAGYPGFRHFMLLNEQKGIYNFVKLLRKVSSYVASFGSSSLLRRYSSLLAVDSVTIDKVYPVLRQILTPASIRELTTLNTSTTNLQHKLIALRGQVEQLGLISQYSAAEMTGYVHNTLLRDADQMGLGVGLEIREPFFDHRLVEFMLSLPDQLKVSKRPKQLLFDTLEPLLPKEIFYRPKKGFVLPWDDWMRNELSSFCKASIDRIAERPQFNKKAIKQLCTNFNQKNSNVRWTDVWLFVVLSHWLDKNSIQ